MNSKDFKIIFGEVAKFNDYESAFGGWYKKSTECIVVLELQKSSYSNSNYINIKVFIQNAFNSSYLPNKELINSSMGHISKQIRDKDFLDINNSLDDEKRKQNIHQFFTDYIMPFTEKVLSKKGIKELSESEEIILLPAIKEFLQ